MPVIKDLVTNLKNLYKQLTSIKPWLHNNGKQSEDNIENLQTKSDRAKLDGLYECILCACCSTSCPAIGGIVISIWDQQFYCNPIDGSR